MGTTVVQSTKCHSPSFFQIIFVSAAASFATNHRRGRGQGWTLLYVVCSPLRCHFCVRVVLVAYLYMAKG